VLADESLLEIAVLNLLDNACKYAELGTEVRIELRQEAARVGIAVIDQGPGIGPEQQKKIFEDYVRLQPEGPVHGIGLGLAFVRRIATVLNGSVELDSSLGQGCTFSLWLPAFSAKNPS
jgi:signal transduction histidine kinase